MQYPDGCEWLGRVGTLPRMVTAALNDLGVIEGAGKLNNPTIMRWADHTGLRPTYTADSIPWCGLAMASWAKRSGYDLPENPLWALNWRKFGVDGGQPELGDVLSFMRTDSEGRTAGHVALYIGETVGSYLVLGGNQRDRVCVVPIAKDRLRGCRQPPYRNKPPSVKPYVLTGTGALLSTNEQ